MDRYEIGCNVQGVICYIDRKAEAFRVARNQEYCDPLCSQHCNITVYDRLAHHGLPELWSHNGEIIKIKK